MALPEADDDVARRSFGGALHPELQAEIDRVPPDVWALVRLWTHYERGFLLCAGGMDAQPQRYVEAMELLSREIGRGRRQKHEQRRGRIEGGHANAGRAPLKIHGAPKGGMTRVV